MKYFHFSHTYIVLQLLYLLLYKHVHMMFCYFCILSFFLSKYILPPLLSTLWWYILSAGSQRHIHTEIHKSVWYLNTKVWRRKMNLLLGNHCKLLQNNRFTSIDKVINIEISNKNEKFSQREHLHWIRYIPIMNLNFIMARLNQLLFTEMLVLSNPKTSLLNKVSCFQYLKNFYLVIAARLPVSYICSPFVHYSYYHSEAGDQ